jgi:hypothetical protein
VSFPTWRCPLCNTLADHAREHLADVHGVGGEQDRFGLRDAVRKPRRSDADDEQAAPDSPSDESATDASGGSFGPPIWRRIPPAPRGRRSPADDQTSESPLTWRRAPRPASSRPRRVPTDGAPQKPIPLPPDAAVLRLVCETLDGVDAQVLRDRLLNLAGVESVAVDLYARIVDLYLDRTRATAPHLVALARERVRLPVRAAELHRAPEKGQPLGAATLIFIVQ